MKFLKMTDVVSKFVNFIGSQAMNQSKDRYASLNDGDTV